MEPLNCSNCGEPLEAGAAFCGNCGQQINHATVTGRLAVAAASESIPAYAVPQPTSQSRQLKAGMALVLGGLGTAGSFFIPLVGIGMGAVGLVLATLGRHAVRRRTNLLGFGFSVIAILVGLGSWAYVIAHDPRFHHQPVAANAAKPSGQAITANNLITPCYSVNFVTSLNIENADGSCNMSAYNGTTLNASSNAYKIYGATSAISASSFDNLAKQAIENDIKQSLPGFAVTREAAGQFAGSPAYFVATTNGSGVSVMEAAVLHQTTNGDNFFVFVHAENSSMIDLKDLQAGWHWE